MAKGELKRKRNAAETSSGAQIKRSRKQQVVEEPVLSDSDESLAQEDDEEEPTMAQYIGESDMEDVESSEEEEDGPPEDEGLGGLKNALGSLPLGALLKAQKTLAPPPMLEDSEEEHESSRRSRPSKTGRTEPRRSSAIAGPSSAKSAQAVAGPSRGASRPEKRIKPHRDSKHAPTEMTSKRAVGRARQVIDVPKIARRDPRFDPLSGAVDQAKIDRAYSFLDEQREQEVKALQARLRAPSAASLSAADREALTATATRMADVDRRLKKEKREREVLSNWRKEESSKRSQGKGAHHLSRREQRELLQKDRADQLASDKHAARKSQRRKEMKQAAKDKKRKPADRV